MRFAEAQLLRHLAQKIIKSPRTLTLKLTIFRVVIKHQFEPESSLYFMWSFGLKPPPKQARKESG